jgi:hypothetical protein
MAAREAIDAWLDDTPARWFDAATLLPSGGHAAEAATALDEGRAGLRRAAATLPDGAAQRLSLQRHAVHRQIMQGRAFCPGVALCTGKRQDRTLDAARCRQPPWPSMPANSVTLDAGELRDPGCRRTPAMAANSP